jgi:HD superfamily phosphodiesterase
MTSATIAGIPIPGSPLAREAIDLVREIEDDLLYHHSLRVFVFGALHGDRHGLRYDPELLLVGSLFHDIGLVEGHRSAGDRFEVDGANAAREFLRRHGIADNEVRIVWDAIALHTTPGIPQHKEAEVALVTAGVELDVLGVGYDALHAGLLSDVLERLPRPDFKRQIIHAFAQGIAHKPATAFGNVKADVLERELPGYVRPNFCELILTSPFAE